MAFWDRWRKADAPKPAGVGVTVGMGGEAQPLVTSATYPLAYVGNPWVYAGVQRIATAVASLEWVVEKKRADEWINVGDHAMLDLWQHVNTQWDLFMFLEASVSWLALHGNTYWLLAGADEGKPPASLFVLPSDRVAVVPQDAPPWISHYTYRPDPNKEAIRYELHEIAHMLRWNPTDPNYGMGPIRPLEKFINASHYTTSFSEKFVKRGGIPAGVLQSEDPLGDVELETLEKRWRQFRATTESAAVPLILGRGMEYIDIGKSVDTVLAKEFPEYLQETILTGIGVPPAMVGILRYANYSNVREQTRIMWNDTAAPYSRQVGGRATESVLIPHFSKGAEKLRMRPLLEKVEAMKPERTESMKDAKEATSGGLMTINEARAEFLGLGEVPWGNEWWAPWNLAPIGGGAVAAKSLSAGDAYRYLFEKTGVLAPPTIDATSFGAKAGELAGERTEAALSLALTAAGHSQSRSAENIRTMPPEQAKTLGEKIDRQRDLFAEQLVDPAGEWFQALGEQMIAAVSSAGGMKSHVRAAEPNVDELLFDEAAAAVMLTDALLPIAEAAYIEGGGVGLTVAGSLPDNTADFLAGIWGEPLPGGAVGAPMTQGPVTIPEFDLPASRFNTFVENRTHEFRSVASRHHDRVRGIVSAAMERGATEAELTEELQGWMLDGQERFAQVIARTEATIAYNMGMLDGYRQVGAPFKQWIAIGDNDTRDSHEAINATVIPIDDLFELSPNVFAQGPGDPSLPADEVCNCRCVLVPAFGDTPIG